MNYAAPHGLQRPVAKASSSEEAHLLQEQLQAVPLRRLARQLPLRLAGARHLVPRGARSAHILSIKCATTSPGKSTA